MARGKRQKGGTRERGFPELGTIITTAISCLRPTAYGLLSTAYCLLPLAYFFPIALNR
jgi:hypothetical protein